VADRRTVAVTAFTDPFSPACWGAEPLVRRMQAEFGEQVAFSWVVVGLAREVDAARARSLAREALEVAAQARMPVDPRGLLDDPPRSTYPAGLAVAAVAEQADGGPYLRRLREAVLLERRRMDSAEALLDAAREVGGLDLDRLRIDFGSNAIVEGFGAGLERARAVDPRHFEPGTVRVAIPSIEARGPDGAVHGVYGPGPYERWREAVIAAGAAPVAEALSVEAALERWPALTTAEVAAACGLPYERAAAELWRLAMEWRARPRPVLGGELWTRA
jgi:predicted DsbA family dithiol-disulfide isomerase